MEQEKKVLLIRLSASEDRRSQKVLFDDDNFLRRFDMKKFFLLSFFILCFAILTAASPIPGTRMSFQDAKDYCRSINRYLATADELKANARTLASRNLKCPYATFITLEGLAVSVSEDCRVYVSQADRSQNGSYDVICHSGR